MTKNPRILIGGIFVSLLAGALYYLSHTQIAVLSPAGPIADKQRSLLFLATGVMLLIVLPVFGLTFYIAWKYRASNTAANYQPDWDHDFKLEAIWWGFPCLIVVGLGFIAWSSSHSLDPFKPLQSSIRPLTVQVVALQWKWLFIYPEQQIASVNFLQIPTGRPVNFEVTSDAPMNSFWIPRLGGQIYAMSGMSTQLHLMASKSGDYRGSSANISGLGFTNMHFIARAGSDADFTNWVLQAKVSPNLLNSREYERLARPNSVKQPIYYSSYQSDLYNSVVGKYMSAPHDTFGVQANAPATMTSHKTIPAVASEPVGKR